MGGYRLRLADWEGRTPSNGTAKVMPWGSGVAYGQSSLLTADPIALSSFEFEWIYDDTAPGSSSEGAKTALRYLFGDSIADAWSDLPAVGSQSISANRDLDVPDAWRSAGVSCCDLRFSTLPTRHGRAAIALVYGTRWVRIIRSAKGIAAFWNPIEGPWLRGDVRWPHHAVPSRNEAWIRTGALLKRRSVEARLCAFLKDCVDHELYFVGNNFDMEFETWEQGMFKSISEGAAMFEVGDLSGIQRDLALLGDYLSDVRYNQRALLRRQQVSKVLSGKQIGEMLTEAADRLRVMVAEQRERIRTGFALLSSVGTGQILSTSHQAQRSAQRLQDFVSAMTAIFLVPGLVVAFYSSNLEELISGAKGSSPSLFAYMSAAAVITWSVVRVAAGRPPLPKLSGGWNWILTAVILFVAVAEEIALVKTGRRPPAMFFAFAMLVAVTIQAFVLSKSLTVKRQQQQGSPTSTVRSSR